MIDVKRILDKANKGDDAYNHIAYRELVRSWWMMRFTNQNRVFFLAVGIIVVMLIWRERVEDLVGLVAWSGAVLAQVGVIVTLIHNQNTTSNYFNGVRVQKSDAEIKAYGESSHFTNKWFWRFTMIGGALAFFVVVYV